MEHCATMSVHEIMELPDVKERMARYFELDALPFIRSKISRFGSSMAEINKTASLLVVTAL